MSSYQKVTIVGNLGSDPELKEFDGGGKLCNVSIATSESWTDKESGEKKESTEWHRVVFRNKLAEIANKYLKKGGKVLVEGKLKTRSWEKDGHTVYTTEIIVRDMKMLGGKERAEGADNTPPPNGATGGGEPDDLPF